VVAFAQEQARQARAQADSEPEPAAPAGVLFWLAWIVLGIAGGLGAHFYLMWRASRL
jgi:hypothetical protein